MKVKETIKNFFVSIAEGKFLMRLRISDRFPQILVCIIMGFIAIAFSLMIENTLIKVNRNNIVLEQQKDEIALKTIELSKISNRQNLEEKLKSKGSDLRGPVKPAKHLKKK